MTRDEVLEIVREAVAAFNETRDEAPLPFALETPLYGAGAALDSLDLVVLLVEVEGRLADRFGLEQALSDDRALSQKRSPFRTIGTLVDYILSLGAPSDG